MKKILILFSVLLAGGYYPLQSQNWISLGKGINHASINNLLPDSNCLYISGSFTEDGNNIPMRGIAKWDGNKWDSVGDANNFNATKHAICKFRDTLITSGLFYNWQHCSLVRLKEDEWVTYSGGVELEVESFAEKDGVLYFGGCFNTCGNDSTYGLGKFDGTSFTGLTPSYENGPMINCIAFYDDTLYVAGNFYLTPNLPIAGLAKWDGYNLIQISPQFSGNLCTLEAMAVYKNELYIGGAFYQSLGFTGNNIMKWDGHNFIEVGGGADDRVTCMTVYNNELYIGGWFTHVGGIVSKNIAKWDGNNWTSLNTDDFDDPWCIRDICIFKDELYVAGFFETIGGDTMRSIAKYNHPLSLIKKTDDVDKYISIFPNPTTSLLTISLQNTSKTVHLSVYNILGKEIISKTFAGNKTQIDVMGLERGLYFLRLETTEGISQSKFVKE